jgi:capsular exopolysaccharide synthesis family protein
MSPLDSSKPLSPSRASRPARSSPPERAPHSLTDSDDLPSGIPPILSAVPTFGALLAALGRRWLLALVVVLTGGALTAALICFLVPARYTGEMRIQIRRPPDYMPGSADNSTMDDYLRSQAQFIRSARVINAALQRDEVRILEMIAAHTDDSTWLTKDLLIKAATGENILPIKLTGDDPEDTSRFLTGLFNAYKAELHKDRLQQLDRLQRIVAKDEEELISLSKKLPPSEVHQLELASTSVTRARAELRLAQANLDTHKNERVTVDSRTVADAVEDALRLDPEIVDITKSIAFLRREIERLRLTLKDPNDPRIVKDREEHDQLKDDLRIAREQLMEKKERQLRESARRAHDTELKKLEEKVARWKEEESAWAGEILRLEGGMNPELRSLDARRKVLETVRNQTLQTITRIQRDGTEIPWVSQLGLPNTPSTKDRSQQLKAAGAGTVFMMGLLLFGVAYTEFRSRKASSSDEITFGLGIPTVGTLPLLPAQVRQAALSATTPRDLQWEGRLTEAVDAVRTFLLRSLGDGPHVVLVTSAVQGEGKTSLASQLAASLARAWRKTLLIDGDLRKPAAHQLFDLPGEPGFSDVLRGETDPADVIKQTAVSRLWLMPAGQWDPHAHQALAQEGVATLFEHLKEEFDLIIVDSCPVLPVTDTLLLGQNVDTVLLSVLKGTSRLPMVYAARQRLGALDIPVLGTVFVGGSSALGGLDIQYPHPSR